MMTKRRSERDTKRRRCRRRRVPLYGTVPRLLPTCVPTSPIPYTPFSYCDIAKELNVFIEDVYPTLGKIADAPLFTEDLQRQFFAYLNDAAEQFISTTPYPGFSRILTVVRTDGIVVVDKTVMNPKAVMIGATTTGGTLNNVTITRQNTGDPLPYPSTLTNVNNFLTLKVYFSEDGSIQRYDIFDPFSTRTEFMQANLQNYGWTTRPGIYVPGQIYCVAKAVGFYGKSTITFFFRVCYYRAAT